MLTTLPYLQSACAPTDSPRRWRVHRQWTLQRHGALLALLLDFLERLREPLERILVGRRRPATGCALHRQVGALAHGIDHARLLGDVLDPGTVVLRVHRELDSANLGGRIGAGLEWIADDDRHLVLYVVGRAGRDEDIGRIALAARRPALPGLPLGKRQAHLAPPRPGGPRRPTPAP